MSQINALLWLSHQQGQTKGIMKKFWHSMLLWRLVIALECVVLLFGIIITVGHFYLSYVTTRVNIQNELLLEINTAVERESYHYLQAQLRLQTLASLWSAMLDDENFSVTPRHATFVPFSHIALSKQLDNSDHRLAKNLVELFGNTNANNCEAPYIILPDQGGIFYNFNNQDHLLRGSCPKDRVDKLMMLNVREKPTLHWGNVFKEEGGELFVPLQLASQENDALFGMNVQVWRMPMLVDNQLWNHISFAMLNQNTLQMLQIATTEKAILPNELPDKTFFSSCSVNSVHQINGYYFVCKAFQGPPWLMVARYPISMITIQALHDQVWQLLFTLVTLLTLSLIIYWVLRKQMGKPLQHLVDKVGRFGVLDDHAKLPENRSDELGHIARSYNQLIGVLKTTYQTMETQVQERTLALNEAKRNAELLSTRKSEHIANISHEIRTPMNGVVGALELLGHTTLTQTQRELVEVAHSSSEYLLAIINNLIDYRHIETGQLELSYESAELLPLLDSVLLTVHLTAQQKGLTLSVLVMTDVPARMVMNRLRLEQILINLLGNAVKFTEKGSVTMLASCKANQLIIEVKDTGPGISANKHKDIFHPFVQINTYSGGNGLGLTIARMLAQLMGGDIALSSQPGKGACFTLRLPLRAPEGQLRRYSGTIKAPAALHPQLQQWGLTPKEGKNRRLSSPGLAYLPGRLQQHLLKIFYRQEIPKHDDVSVTSFCPWSLKVLVVDDVATNREIIKRLLHELGHRTELAASGDEALTRGRNVIYDMVLMDLRMPEMDGFETTRRWRDVNSGMLDTETPIIALSADLVTLTQQDIQMNQMQGFLIKPLKMKKLHHIIEKVIVLQLARGMELQPSTGLQKPIIDVTDDKLQEQLKTTFLALAQHIIHAWENSQKEELADYLHTLKGCAGLAGVEDTYRLAEQLSVQLNAGNWPREPEVMLLQRQLTQWPKRQAIVK
ncbi:two component system sensor kinase [Klebsiella michiganensis]|jgi:two-component system secretion sensor histidine kinase SsrA|uniref:two component system sensor kinase n=1 Tax=Klebsiella michiganensis TaxID=1134687 RepID=UPI0025700A79|nr:two component system sensor kinase [Klebsiella michiganensis]MDL4454968.1 two component system sensor kinase [Klebsiella michiganensis]